MGVDGSGARHREENSQRLQMTSDVIATHRLQVDIFAHMNEIEDIGRRRRKNRDEAINDIIRLIMYEQEHCPERNKFERNGTERDVAVLLKRLVKPLHSDGGQKDSEADNDVELSVLLQRRHKDQRQRQQDIGHHAHDQINAEKLMNGAGQLFPVVPHLGAGADTISRHT